MAYINREDLLATINEVWERKYAKCDYKLLYDVYRMVIRRINRAQEADVEPVKHGEWVSKNNTEYCSLCNAAGMAYSWSYCPKCGSKMDGGIINVDL